MIFSTLERAPRALIRLQSHVKNPRQMFFIMHSEYQWRKTRNAYIKTDNKCNCCGTDKKLEVHHIKPWHIDIALRYVHLNLITLCRECHFRFGHGLNWRDWNPEIRELVEAMKPHRDNIKKG